MTKLTSKSMRIDTDLLIPGRGEPIRNASLIYDGAVIQHVGPSGELPNDFTNLKPVKVRVLMPGMWDCHVHLVGGDKYSVSAWAANPPFLAGMRSARDSVATLNAGFTSVREMAGYGVDMTTVIEEGWIPGPRIYSAVSMLSQTAGHGDSPEMPVPCLWDKIEHGLPFYICDGVDECLKAVRRQVRRGASVIKVAASGGVASSGDDIMNRQFTDGELETIVREATKNKLAVGAHCHAPEATEAALRAGCTTIEHGTFLNEKVVDLMAEKDAMLIATRSTLEYAIRDRSNWTDAQYEQLLEIKKHHEKSYAMAIKKGIRCAIGTDLGVSSIKKDWNHGMNGVEFQYAVEAGMTALEAIEAGTANGPQTLGPKAPRSGQLKKGYDADFISLDQSPLDDVRILGDPSNIQNVWKAGKLYKEGGKPIGILD